jgi:hypothetical protein
MRTGVDARSIGQDLFLDSVCYTRVPLKSRVPEVVPQMGIHVLLPLFTHSTPRRVYIPNLTTYLYGYTCLLVYPPTTTMYTRPHEKPFYFWSR